MITFNPKPEITIESLDKLLAASSKKVDEKDHLSVSGDVITIIPLDGVGSAKTFNISEISDRKISEMLKTTPLVESFNQYQERFDNVKLEDISKELKEGDSLAPGFKSLLKLPAEFWGDFKMTKQDLELFAGEIGDNWGTGFDNKDDAFQVDHDSLDGNDYHTLEDGKLEPKGDIGDTKTFEVNGSGLVDDYRFDSVEAFFNWLKK